MPGATLLSPRPGATAASTASARPATLPLAHPHDGPKLLVRGRERILALQPMLRDLAAITGQAGEADDLRYVLDSPDARRREPVLVLSRAEPGEPAVRNLKDAALLFEDRLFGRGTRLFATRDATGRSNILAAAPHRAAAAASAAAALFGAGALLVHLAFCPGPEQNAPAEGPGSPLADELPAGTRWALTRHLIPLYLPLGPTLEATLSRIGRRTRSNLRSYRRRTERETGCVFVPEVRMPLREFLGFNRTCTGAVPDALATWRFQQLKTIRDPLLAGVQDCEGRWLALAGGRRRGTAVEVDWQINRAGLPKLALSTVLRSCLIEAEVARGSERLYLEGSALQPIGRSLAHAPVATLTIQRGSLSLQLLARFGSGILARDSVAGRLLRDPDLTWHSR